MSIQKKSLISTLQTAKKAKVASAPLAEVNVEATTDKKLTPRKLTPRKLSKAAMTTRKYARRDLSRR